MASGDERPDSERGTSTPPSRDEATINGHGLEGGKELEAQKPAAEVDFPEGGLRAWSVVLGVWILQFCTFGYTNAHGVYSDYYVRQYLSGNYTSSQISWIGSTQLFLVLSLGLISGRGFDTGYYYPLMLGGSALLVFCVFMLSLSHPEHYYQVWLVQGLGIGIACGVTYVPGFGLISHYFRRRRPIAMGVVASGAAVGGAIHPIMLNKLFHGPVGFHNGVRASGGFLAGLLIIANLLMKPRLPPSPSKGGSTWNDLKTFACDPPYALTVFGTLLVIASIYIPIFFLQTIAIKHGIDSNTAFYTIVILNFASAIGRVTPTFLVPKFGVYNIMIPCVVITGGLVFVVLALDTVASTIVFAVLYGYFTGTYAGLFAPMIASLARKDTEMGARLGICFTFTGLGGLIGSPVGGALLSTHYLWWRPVVFSGVCTFVAAGCFFISRLMLVRRKGTWKL